ncbi:MAG TPA: cupin domain-containing protein [Thermoanaerobaculia bacterium]|jgi:oxalate decarboxylase/phosphoglucose isomerase-like protein (cupin superfamily)
MNPGFESIVNSPENQIFKVVFFPDRIYHAQYLNATRSPRYRYNVMEVRGYADVVILKGELYLDGNFLCNFLRIEYRAARLVELMREKGRLLGYEIVSWLRVRPANEQNVAEARVRLHFDPWINAFQTEIWETLEAPGNGAHDLSVLDMMGRNGPITRVKQFGPALADIKGLRRVEIAFSEPESTPLSGHKVDPNDVVWDNDYTRTHQEPVTDNPSDPRNTIPDQNYLIDFQRGYYQQAADVKPVRYRNAMMEPDRNKDAKDDNIIEMRWLFQRELGSSLIFFHEVTIPAGKVEGNHQHVGSEELYFITQGQGVAYLRDGDDPATDSFPSVEREVFGIGPKSFKELPVKPGSMIFTKSGGMHGIRNTSSDPASPPLKFVAFLYHSV